MSDKKVALLILDGWGLGDGSTSDAIASANTPFMDTCRSKFPNSTLHTDGAHVGLPDGQMGNSEVGHLNIGAGRVVFQDLQLINNAIKDGAFQQNKTLLDAFNHAKENNKSVHFIGLISDGGVHSDHLHLHALCDMALANGLEKVFIHAFTDGRDTDPKSGLGFLTKLQEKIESTPIKIATVVGRYNAMDRDKRWDRTKIAYDLLVTGKGKTAKSALHSVQNAYDVMVTDEFMKATTVTHNYAPVAMIKDGDVVISFNFRTDRCRQLVEALTQKDMPEHGMKKLDLYFVTMTNYDDTFQNIHVVFGKNNLANTLGEVVSKAGKKQLRISETEKYPHVTYFFSGGRESEFEGESRVMIPSPKVRTYDMKPEMSALEVKDAAVAEINKNTHDFICLNFANADMVGHTGVYPAIIKAVETVDKCAEEVVNAATQQGYSVIIIADHGNADFAINADGSPNTAHTTNPVPCIVIDKDTQKVNEGTLADIAPTILKLMNLPQPSEMTGKSLA